MGVAARSTKVFAAMLMVVLTGLGVWTSSLLMGDTGTAQVPPHRASEPFGSAGTHRNTRL
jgi:hypothetical protein